MVLYASSLICVVHADMTLTRSKVKVTGLQKFRKLHFSKSVSANMTCSSKFWQISEFLSQLVVM